MQSKASASDNGVVEGTEGIPGADRRNHAVALRQIVHPVKGLCPGSGVSCSEWTESCMNVRMGKLTSQMEKSNDPKPRPENNLHTTNTNRRAKACSEKDMLHETNSDLSLIHI